MIQELCPVLTINAKLMNGPFETLIINCHIHIFQFTISVFLIQFEFHLAPLDELIDMKQIFARLNV